MDNSQKIHFTAFAQAYYVDMEWGYGCPSGGIRNMGTLFHKYNIPITWMVSPKSARCEMDVFTEYHEKFGDEIGMFFRFEQHHHSNERKIANQMSFEEYQGAVRQQKEEIQRYLPWADLKVAGQGIRTRNLLKALQAEGFLGMFGHCPYQIGTDSITDYGMPWGSFPTDPEDPHKPAKQKNNGLITFEWTARDLNRSFHTTYPELWSTDPNDVERGGVCTDTNVVYWKNMFQQYERALPLNPHGIWFQFHQEAHEQTWGEICKPFTQERVIYCTKMMDLFLEWLVQRPTVEFLPATEALKKYLTVQPTGTMPRYHPFAWTSIPENVPFWDQIRQRKGYSGGLHKCVYLPIDSLHDYLMEVNGTNPEIAMRTPPWTDSFFYYDEECQLIFDIGKIAPVALFNYLNFESDPELVDMMQMGGGMPGFYLEPHIPQPLIRQLVNNAFKIVIENPLKKVLPYGIFLWKKSFPGILEQLAQFQVPSQMICKIIPDQGVFLRFMLQPGNNGFILQK